jgi:hypothetical protein
MSADLSTREGEALKRFEMISPLEATVRQLVGLALAAAVTILLVLVGPTAFPVGVWALLISAAIMLFRMGQLSQ